jgi:N-methylhydantoinase A
MVSLRMVVVGASPQPKVPAEPRRDGSPVPAKQIDVYLDGAWRKVPLYRRADLGHGHRLPSPCVVAQEDTTICVPEGFTGTVDAYGNILLSLDHVPTGQ